MASVKTNYEHILLEDGVPVIAGTTTKVIELVEEKKGWGWTAEEIGHQHPYLTMGQIYSAMAYYSDHSAELDADIERRLKLVDEIKASMKPSPLIAKLEAKGLI